MTYRNHLLCELPDDLRGRVRTHMQPVPLRMGATLQVQGEAPSACYFIESGLVALTRALADGERMEAGLVGREGLVGGPESATPAFTDARVELAGEAFRIELRALQGLLAQEPVLRDVLGRYRQYQLEEAQLSSVCNATHGIDERLAKWLLRCLDRIDGHELPITQGFLSEMLGVQRTTVTAALQRLTARGVLQTRRGVIQMVDRDGLTAIACECYEDAAERLPELGFPEVSDRSSCEAA